MTAYNSGAVGITIGLAGSNLTHSYASVAPLLGDERAYNEGFDDGVASVPGKNLVAPVVTITSIPTNEEDPVVIEAYDVAPGINLIGVTCQDRSDGPKLTVYDSGGFYHPFRGTVTGAGTQLNPYVYTIYRRGRWPTGIGLSFKARFVDSDGNVSEVTV